MVKELENVLKMYYFFLDIHIFRSYGTSSVSYMINVPILIPWSCVNGGQPLSCVQASAMSQFVIQDVKCDWNCKTTVECELELTLKETEPNQLP